jgi:hypothetical protein
VYVQRFPSTEQRWQVSTGGGVQPVWRGDGRELYILGLDGMLFAVDFRPGTLDSVVPRPLFRPPIGAITWGTEQYATVDGNRFLVLKPVGRPQRPIHVIVNWSVAASARTAR